MPQTRLENTILALCNNIIGTNGQTDRETDQQKSRDTERQTDGQTDRHTNRQIKSDR